MRSFWITLLVIALASTGCAPSTPTDSPATVRAQHLTQLAATPRAQAAPITSGPIPSPTVLYQLQHVPVNKALFVEDGIQVKFTGQVRPATDAIKKAGPSSPTASLDEDYVQVTLEVACGKPASGECNVSTFFSKLTLANVEQKATMINFSVNPPADDLHVSTLTLAGTHTVKGSLYFVVPKSLANVVLVYFVTQPPYPILNFETK